MRKVIALAVLLTACSSPAVTPGGTESAGLPDFAAAEFTDRLETSTRPLVVNLWGSWCIPCRSEAPLLAEAHRLYGDKIDFIGVNIEDSRAGATAFLLEFGIEFENLYDPASTVRSLLPGFGAPITYFLAPGGEVVKTHLGVIDEQQLALQIDELLNR